MQQETQFDLIVVGGGTAGAFSAIAAAREGLKGPWWSGGPAWAAWPPAPV